jgi:hypothetical protein
VILTRFFRSLFPPDNADYDRRGSSISGSLKIKKVKTAEQISFKKEIERAQKSFWKPKNLPKRKSEKIFHHGCSCGWFLGCVVV